METPSERRRSLEKKFGKPSKDGGQAISATFIVISLMAVVLSMCGRASRQAALHGTPTPRPTLSAPR